MEEADALCDNLMIMSEGEIKCIGVGANLKGRFGEGFKLSIQTLKNVDQEKIHKFVLKIAPNATLMNYLSGTSNYQIPSSDVSLGKVFEEVEKYKDDLLITDWAIVNTTLEEVFLKISLGTVSQVEEKVRIFLRIF